MTTVGSSSHRTGSISNSNSYMIENYNSHITKRNSIMISTSMEQKIEAGLEAMIKNNKYLVSLEDEGVKDATKKILKKKEIISYTANRDTLFIPHSEKSKRPVDISDKIIENKTPTPIADLAIQSDPIDYVNEEKTYVPQKIGRDIGVQIEDGDLFNFDRDVQPLLIVLSGKLLEQALLELHEEEEIKNLRDMKQIYAKKFHEEKLRMKNIEKIEIRLKKDNDALKKIKMVERITKINTQQKLFTRSFAKSYLTNLCSSSMKDLQKKAMFVDYNKALLKNKLNEEVFIEMEKQILSDGMISATWQNLPRDIQADNMKLHRLNIQEHKRMIDAKLYEEERKKEEEAEKRRIEEEEKKEKKRLRAIRRLKESIRKNIFDIGVIKNEYHLEVISEIDNFEEEGPFIGIYGGLIGSLIITLSLFRKYIIPNDNLFPLETIMDILGYYLAECGKIDIYLDRTVESKLKEVLDRDDIEINNLKTYTDLDMEDWINIAKTISDLSLSTDYIMKELLVKYSSIINLEFYPMIVKALCLLSEKGTWIDKINFIFKPSYNKTILQQKLSTYQAVCKLNMNEGYDEILDTVSFVKDSKKKIKVPEFYDEIKVSRYFQQISPHNVLIYDKNAEFIIRNKFLEMCLRTIVNEVDSRQAFIIFNRHYEEFISTADSEILEGLPSFEYSNSEIMLNI